MTVGPKRVARLAGIVVALAAAIAPGVAQSAPSTELQFLGQQIIPTATQFQGTTFGGLSGMAYDERRNVFYAFSDDPANVRFYTLRIGVSTGVPGRPDPRRDDAARRLRPAVRDARRSIRKGWR